MQLYIFAAVKIKKKYELKTHVKLVIFLILKIKNYKDEVVTPSLSEPSSAISANVILEVDDLGAAPFDVKSLNGIEDKMSRGIAKKAFTGAKREALDDNGKIDAIKLALNEAGKMSSEIEALLSSFISTTITPVEATSKVSLIPDVGLFDIKLLNDIDDKMARGSAKKVYMAGKRGNKSTIEVVADIRNELTGSGMMDDDIDNLIKGIG